MSLAKRAEEERGAVKKAIDMGKKFLGEYADGKIHPADIPFAATEMINRMTRTLEGKI